MLEFLKGGDVLFQIIDPEIKNNLDLYLYISKQKEVDQKPEYDRIAPTLSFKVKSFAYLMKKGAQVAERGSDA